jgi:hypothetical protein
MLPVGAKMAFEGSYTSADAEAPLSSSPPAYRTLPFMSRVAVE